MAEESKSPEAMAPFATAAAAQAETEARLAAAAERSLADAPFAGSGSPPAEPAAAA